MICPNCGQSAYAGAHFCPACGLSLAADRPVDAPPPWPAETFGPPPVAFGPPPAAFVPPPNAGTPYSPPPGKPAPPPEIWVVAGLLVLVGGVVLYPLLRYGFPLVPWLFRSSLERGIAGLILAVFVLIGSVGVALIAIAVLLVRGSRVGRALACVACGAVAFGFLVEGQTTARGTGNQSTVSVLVVLACAASIVLVTSTPSARRFFSFDADRPVGVLAATVLAVYLGGDTVAVGLFLLPVGALGSEYVAYGLLLIALGGGLIAVTRPLRMGNPGARIVVSGAFIAYAILAALVGKGLANPAALLALCACIGCLVLLWLVPSSAAHFAAHVGYAPGVAWGPSPAVGLSPLGAPGPWAYAPVPPPEMAGGPPSAPEYWSAPPAAAGPADAPTVRTDPPAAAPGPPTIQAADWSALSAMTAWTPPPELTTRPAPAEGAADVPTEVEAEPRPSAGVADLPTTVAPGPSPLDEVTRPRAASPWQPGRVAPPQPSPWAPASQPPAWSAPPQPAWPAQPQQGAAWPSQQLDWQSQQGYADWQPAGIDRRGRTDQQTRVIGAHVLLWGGLVAAAVILTKIHYFASPIVGRYSRFGLLPWTDAAAQRAASVLVLLAPLAASCLVMPAQALRRVAALSAILAAGVLSYVFFESEVGAIWAVAGMIATLVFSGWLILRARSAASLALLLGAFALSAGWFASRGPGQWLQQVPAHLHWTSPLAWQLWFEASFLLLVPLGFAARALSRTGRLTVSPGIGFAAVAGLALAAMVVAVTTTAISSNRRVPVAASEPTNEATSTAPVAASLSSEDAAATVGAFLDASAGGNDPGSGWDCTGAVIIAPAVSSYAIDAVSPATTGAFDVHVTVTLTDGSIGDIVYRVDPAGAGSAARNGCLSAETSVPAPSGPLNTSPVPAATHAPAQPADVPSVPTSSTQVPMDATPPGAPVVTTVVPYTDLTATPTRGAQLVEWQPSELSADQGAAVRSVTGFLIAINQQNFTAAWNLTTERLHGSTPDARFTSGYATSRHYQLAFGQPRQLTAGLVAIPARFVSRQDPAAQGNPGGVTDCTYWPQYVFLVAKVNGRWLDDVAADYIDRPEVRPLKRVDPTSRRVALNPPSQRAAC
jgi:hypothetical protein